MRRLGLAIVAIVSCAKPEQPTATSEASVVAAPSASGSASAAASVDPIVADIVPPPRPAVDASVPISSLTWKTYRGDKFTVSFPGEPKVKELPVDEGKVGYTEASFDVPGGQVSFAAGFTDHEKNDVAKPDEFLDGRVNAPRRGTTDVLHKRSITLANRYPGRVLILRRNISGTPLRIYSRLYLVGLRLYSLIVSTLDEGGVSEDVVKKFMESFKLN